MNLRNDINDCYDNAVIIYPTLSRMCEALNGFHALRSHCDISFFSFRVKTAYLRFGGVKLRASKLHTHIIRTAILYLDILSRALFGFIHVTFLTKN